MLTFFSYFKSTNHDIIVNIPTCKKCQKKGAKILEEKVSRENKTSLLRIIKIDVVLRDGKPHSAAELAEHLGKSKRTILRDIEDLRDTWHAPIASSPQGYYYTERAWFFPAIYLSEGDMISVGILSKSFDIFKGTPLWAPMQDILDNVLSPHENTTNIVSPDNQNFAFKEYKSQENEWFENRICISRKPQTNIEDCVWETVIQALKENRLVEFDYSSNEEYQYKQRLVESWQLCFSENRWYLYGNCLEKDHKPAKGNRTYNLEKIKNIKILNKEFVLPAPHLYKKNEYAVGNFGISTTDKTEHYKIILKNYAASESLYEWSEDYKVYSYSDLPENEKIKGVSIPDNAKVIEFSSNQGPGVETFIYSFAANAIPLSPASLVEKWKMNIDEMKKISEQI